MCETQTYFSDDPASVEPLLHSIDMHFLSDDVIICSATDVVNADISVMLNLKCLEGHICPMKYFCHWPKGPYRSHYVMIML